MELVKEEFSDKILFLLMLVGQLGKEVVVLFFMLELP